MRPSPGPPSRRPAHAAPARARGGGGSRRWRGCRSRGRSRRRRGRGPAARSAGSPSSTSTGPSPTQISATRAVAPAGPRADDGADPAHRVVALPPGHLDERAAAGAPAAGGRSRRRPARPGRSADSIGPVKNAAAATSRVPSALRSVTDPSSSRSTADISAAGSACTRLPTVVPRLRIVGWATCRSAWRSSGAASCAARSCSTRLCRASAPTRTASPSTSTASRPGTWLTSTRCAGAASRIDISGTRLCPPASTLPSAPSDARVSSASSRLRGTVVGERGWLHGAETMPAV